MPAPPEDNHSVSHALDLARGLSALAVFTTHWRLVFLVDYGLLDRPGLPAWSFYALVDNAGYQALLVLLLLSGFLIGGSVCQTMAAGGWSWQRYVPRRLARLYVVLLPALLLGLFWDHLGIRLTSPDGIYAGGPGVGAADYGHVTSRLGWQVLLGNALFLQMLLVPPLGTNGPLWTLSLEFWFYWLFPFILLAASRRHAPWVRWIYLAASTGLLAFLGMPLAFYFMIWLVGTACYVVPTWAQLVRRGWAGIAIVAYLLLLCASLVVGRYLGGDNWIVGRAPKDLAGAVIIAPLFYGLLHLPARPWPALWSRLAKGLAGFSYTLYLVHMPALILLRALLIPGRERWQLDASHVALATAIWLAVLVYAYLISRVTEARTETLRRYLLEHLPGARAQVRSSAAP